MRRFISLTVLVAWGVFSLAAQNNASTGAQPELYHPAIGAEGTSADGHVNLRLVDRRQGYSAAERTTYDREIWSPKSVSIHPDGRLYVNSLERGVTVVYDSTMKRIATVSHRFTGRDTSLWAPIPSTLSFTHYPEKRGASFMGKPVEGAFSHGGRYFWVPYYRRSWDVNAQDPSALAVIDTRTDSIVRMFDTSALPKMVCVSPDGRYLAVTHWGDNTVGLWDIASDNPRDWKMTDLITIGKRLKLDYSLTEPVNRDQGSGYALRGTIFSPDGRYLFVTGMSDWRLHVIDLETKKHIKALEGLQGNMRHLGIANGNLYTSCNLSGVVQRVPLDSIYSALNRGASRVNGAKSTKVGKGARTIAFTPDGRYVAVVSNHQCKVYLLDAMTLKVAAEAATDPFPVGLEVTHDGRALYVTCQGHAGVGGGNCVDKFSIIYQ